MGSVLEDDTDVGQLIEGQRHEPARVRAGKGRVEASDVLAIGMGAMRWMGDDRNVAMLMSKK